jgi:hypothetical protein
MINDDHKYPIGLMQHQQQQSFSSPSSVNHIPSSNFTIYDNHHDLTEKNSISSSQVRIRIIIIIDRLL